MDLPENPPIRVWRPLQSSAPPEMAERICSSVKPSTSSHGRMNDILDVPSAGL